MTNSNTVQSTSIIKMISFSNDSLSRHFWNLFSSVRMAVVLLTILAITVLLGAWCPQESQVGQAKIIEQFGENRALILINLGITDIFHTAFFLILIGLLTVNIIIASLRRVFPKALLYFQPQPWLRGEAINKLPIKIEALVDMKSSLTQEKLRNALCHKGYRVRTNSSQLVAERWKFNILSPTITHIGLLLLLTGVTISSWTGFSGFKPVPLHGKLSFHDSDHSRLWIGQLPDWQIKVESTRRENYANGEAKQWYSLLSVIDQKGKLIKREEISVNNPLSYAGVDIYQASWGLDKLQLAFNNSPQNLDLRPMGKLYASFLPLAPQLIMIFSVKDQSGPLRVFAKRPDWEAPKLLGEIPPSGFINCGGVKITYLGAIPVTGLQYKCDPGIWPTFGALFLIMLGVLLASFPHHQVWASFETDSSMSSAESNRTRVTIGGFARKARPSLERLVNELVSTLNGKALTGISTELHPNIIHALEQSEVAHV